MMIARALAQFTETPQFKTGMQAYDVFYRSAEGDQYMSILTYGKEDVAEQIREGLFRSHPEATDYTFRAFDYLDFQMRILGEKAYELATGYSRITNATTVDTTEF
jgi:hypothetical protein